MLDAVREQRVAKLNEAAAERKRETLERAEKGLRKLLLENRRITFPGLAREAGVSVSYLYKYPELVRRVRALRLQQEERGAVKLPVSQPSSEKSKEAVILRLRERLRELETKRQEQEKHIAALSGQVYELSADQQLRERLRDENARLSQRVAELERALTDRSDGASPPRASISDQIRGELETLSIHITSSIAERIQKFPETRVLNAIAVLREAVAAGRVRSNVRLFLKALTEGWEPAEGAAALERKREAREFSKWFDAARAKGLVQSSVGTEKGILVLTADRKWVPYVELRKRTSMTESVNTESKDVPSLPT